MRTSISALALLWPTLLLAATPNVVFGPPPGTQVAGDPTSRESLEKRLFLLARAAERGDCQQAIEAAELIVTDFGDVPGARLGRAHAAACEKRWLEAWNILPAARDAGFDTRALEARIRPNLAFVEIQLTLDGAPLAAKDENPAFTPVVMAGKQPVATTRVGPGRYTVVIEGGLAASVSVAPTAEHAASPEQRLELRPGGTSTVKIGWTTVPVGTLDVLVRVDGSPMSAADAVDIPQPRLELPDGRALEVNGTGLGTWRLERVPSGPVRVRVAEGRSTGGAEAATVVATRETASVVVDLKRIPMATLTRPRGVDPVFVVRVDDRVLVDGESTTLRAGDHSFSVEWTPQGANAPLTTRWSQQVPAGTASVEAPWAHVVVNEDGSVLHRAIHAPNESKADLSGVKVSLPDVRGDDLKVPLQGTITAEPGRIARAVVKTSSHPIYAARGAKARDVRRGLVVLGSGLGVVAGLGGWGALEAGNAAAAAKSARELDAAGGQERYDTLVADAVSATGRANVGIGAAACTAALTLGGWGYYTFKPGPDLAQAAAVALELRRGPE